MVKFKNLTPEELRAALVELARRAKLRKAGRRRRLAADRVRLAELMRKTICYGGAGSAWAG